MFIDFKCYTTLCSPGRKVEYLLTLNAAPFVIVLIERWNATSLGIVLVERWNVYQLNATLLGVVLIELRLVNIIATSSMCRINFAIQCFIFIDKF